MGYLPPASPQRDELHGRFRRNRREAAALRIAPIGPAARQVSKQQEIG